MPPIAKIKIVEQQIPGKPSSENEQETDGLPDLCLYSNEGWAVFFEMKIQSRLACQQLHRHVASAKRFGFESPVLVAVAVEQCSDELPPNTLSKQWRELYAWFCRQESDWARHFVDYVETFEAKAIASNYDIRGTITMFNGLRFDAESPYNYREGKRLIRLLGDELQARKDLQRELGVDPISKGRSAITDTNGVWDFLPMKFAKGAPFISFPHLTMGIRPHEAIAATTIPNGISGGFRTRLKDLGQDRFVDLIHEVERKLRPIIRRSRGSQPIMYATQRHYPSQRSIPIEDGRIQADLRTCVQTKKSRAKYQPEWADAIYQLVVNKRSNIQFGIEVWFDYSCPIVKSKEMVDLFADSWKAMKPLLDFALSKN